MSRHERETRTSYEAYERHAREIRADILLMTYRAGSGHPGSSFSTVELLVWLYNEELRIDPGSPDDPDRDRLIFSKGHASPALYSILARSGFFDFEELFDLRTLEGCLQGHATADIPGIEFTSGSLGQGLSFAIGTGLGATVSDRQYRSFVVLGDGELQEGQIWEAAMSAADRELSDLIAVVDRNGVQNDAPVAETKAISPLASKFDAFGWHVEQCNGHDFESIERAYSGAKSAELPSVIIAETQKGNGVSFMQRDQMGYHATVLSRDEIETALTEMNVEHRLTEIERWETG